MQRFEPVSYEQFGIAALIPGMQHMLALMQAQLDQIREQLGLLQTPPRRAGVNSKGQPVSDSYWGRMTPEQRAAEMRRRMDVSAGRAKSQAAKKGVRERIDAKHANGAAAPKKLHPRDEAHPGHAAWVKMMRRMNKKRWAGMTKEQRKAYTAKAVAARKLKAVNGSGGALHA